MQRKHHTYQKSGLISENGSIATLEDISLQFERHYFSVVFFSNPELTDHVNNNSMLGSLEITASDNGLQYGMLSDGVINLGESTYMRPNLQGSITSARINFSGITDLNGATHYLVSLNSHRG